MNPVVSPANPVFMTLAVFCAFAGIVSAQAPLAMDWRQLGSTTVLADAPDPVGGPVSRVWYEPSGLHVRTRSGRVLRYADEAGWLAAEEAQATAGARSGGGRVFHANGHLLRSEDGGNTWLNMTAFRGQSILGGRAIDFAVAPGNPDEITVVGETGVWRSMDAGDTWSGLNDSLPNLPVRRIVSLPAGGSGLRVESGDSLLEWAPGQRVAWSKAAAVLGTPGVVSASDGDYVYLGFSDGRMMATRSGAARPLARLGESAVEAIWVDISDAATAMAVSGARLYRTFNGGLFWDDITGGLAGGTLHGVAADRASQSVYVATDRGVYYGTFSFAAIGSASAWRRLPSPGLPDEAASDVRLDAGANQLYVALEGSGIFAAMAPHRYQSPAIVSAADGVVRAAAPGALLSVIGRSVQQAEASGRPVPVLAAVNGETQLQVPFDVEGSSLALTLGSGADQWRTALPLANLAPAIFSDRDGSPMILDADSGVLLDAMNPARPSMRVQALCTGLGRVSPDWIAGREAPLERPPAVVAPVRVLLDGQPVEVTRATLAPGYVGFYLVEFEMPAFLNAGTSEFYIEAGGKPSNRVRVYIEP